MKTLRIPVKSFEEIPSNRDKTDAILQQVLQWRNSHKSRMAASIKLNEEMEVLSDKMNETLNRQDEALDLLKKMQKGAV